MSDPVIPPTPGTGAVPAGPSTTPVPPSTPPASSPSPTSSWAAGVPDSREDGSPDSTDSAASTGTLGRAGDAIAEKVPDGVQEKVQEKAGRAVGTAKEEASSVIDDATSSASHVAGTAKEEAAKVASSTREQASTLLHEATSNLRSQSGAGKDRAATGLRGFSQELSSLADGSQDQGVVTDLARQAGQRLGGAADWLDGRDVDGVLRDVQTFARRRPLTFIALAVGAGVVAGRLTRALKDAPSTGSDGDADGGPDTAAAGTDRPGVLAPTATPAVPAVDPRHAPVSTSGVAPDDRSDDSRTTARAVTEPLDAVDSARIEEHSWGTPQATPGAAPGRTEQN